MKIKAILFQNFLSFSGPYQTTLYFPSPPNVNALNIKKSGSRMNRMEHLKKVETPHVKNSPVATPNPVYNTTAKSPIETSSSEEKSYASIVSSSPPTRPLLTIPPTIPPSVTITAMTPSASNRQLPSLQQETHHVTNKALVIGPPASGKSNVSIGIQILLTEFPSNISCSQYNHSNSSYMYHHTLPQSPSTQYSLIPQFETTSCICLFLELQAQDALTLQHWMLYEFSQWYKQHHSNSFSIESWILFLKQQFVTQHLMEQIWVGYLSNHICNIQTETCQLIPFCVFPLFEKEEFVVRFGTHKNYYKMNGSWSDKAKFINDLTKLYQIVCQEVELQNSEGVIILEEEWWREYSKWNKEDTEEECSKSEEYETILESCLQYQLSNQNSHEKITLFHILKQLLHKRFAIVSPTLQNTNSSFVMSFATVIPYLKQAMLQNDVQYLQAIKNGFEMFMPSQKSTINLQFLNNELCYCHQQANFPQQQWIPIEKATHFLKEILVLLHVMVSQEKTSIILDSPSKTLPNHLHPNLRQWIHKQFDSNKVILVITDSHEFLNEQVMDYTYYLNNTCLTSLWTSIPNTSIKSLYKFTHREGASQVAQMKQLISQKLWLQIFTSEAVCMVEGDDDQRLLEALDSVKSWKSGKWNIVTLQGKENGIFLCKLLDFLQIPYKCLFDFDALIPNVNANTPVATNSSSSSAEEEEDSWNWKMHRYHGVVYRIIHQQQDKKKKINTSLTNLNGNTVSVMDKEVWNETTFRDALQWMNSFDIFVWKRDLEQMVMEALVDYVQDNTSGNYPSMGGPQKMIQIVETFLMEKRSNGNSNNNNSAIIATNKVIPIVMSKASKVQLEEFKQNVIGANSWMDVLQQWKQLLVEHEEWKEYLKMNDEKSSLQDEYKMLRKRIKKQWNYTTWIEMVQLVEILLQYSKEFNQFYQFLTK